MEMVESSSPSTTLRRGAVILRKHISTIILCITFITGLSLLLYPTVSNYWNAQHQTQAVVDYTERIEKMDDSEKLLEVDRAVSYNSMLVDNGRRFSPNKEEKEFYNSVLSVDDNGMMGYITIPELRLKLAIYHGVDESVLQVGIGHIEGSSLPVGGESTHCVLSGHRGLPSAKLFTDIDKLVIGDVFMLHVYDEVLTYEVDQILIVEPEDYSALAIEEDKDYCTLVTCTPYGINTHRLLVRGHRVENKVIDGTRVTSDAIKVNKYLVIAGLSLLLLFVYYLFVLIVRLYKKKRHEDYERKKRMLLHEKK